MPGDRPAGAEPPAGLDLERAQGGEGRCGVRFVDEREDRSLGGGVRPDSAGEEDHPAERRVLELPERGREGERAGAQAHRHR
ncbi:MAG: hypothetical protein ABSB90_05245 [Thermoplasmata archaeon]